MRISKRWVTLLRVASRITSKGKKNPVTFIRHWVRLSFFIKIDTRKSYTWNFQRIPTYTL